MVSCARISNPPGSLDGTVDPVVETDTAMDPAWDPPVDGISDPDPEAPVDAPTDLPADVPADPDPEDLPDDPADAPADPPGDDGATACSGTIFSSDFETDNGGFTENPSTSVWDWGAIGAGPPVSGHGNVWATNLSGTYGSCQDASLTSPTIDLSACGGVTMTLTFETWYEYEKFGLVYYDGFLVEMWNGSTWTRIAPVGGWDHTISIYGCSGIYVEGEDGFAHTSSGWVTKTFTVTLTSYPATFKFRFVHGSDVDGHYNGAFIDNVRLTGS